MKNILNFRFFKSDSLGGITAGIVALPLALAFGEQSGLGAAAGLYGAAFIAFFASFFGGTPTQISGPTAPMTALSMIVVAGILQASEGRLDQALPLILFVFLLAGVIQVLMGVLKLGSFIKFIPYTVVSGFMTGIGVIILVTQLLPMMGYYPAQDEQVVEDFYPYAEEQILERILQQEAQDGILVLENFEETIERAQEISREDVVVEAKVLAENDARGVIGALEYLPRAIGKINFVEFLLALFTILIIYGFRKITKIVPSTLVALLLVSGGAYLVGFDYVRIREIPLGLPEFHLSVFSEFNFALLAPYLFSSFLLAMLGAIDSLLTSVVADNMTKSSHNPNKELVGQGIGNSVAAMFGGLPGAGATIRTVVNIQAGGRTKLSGMVAGIFLLGIVVVLAPIASFIPAAVLAGILITVGIGVMDYKGLRAIRKMEFSERAVLIIVLVLTVFWQLVYAVAIGLVLAAVMFLKRVSDISADRIKVSDLDRKLEEEPMWDDEFLVAPEIRKRVFFKHLDGPLFFGFASHFRNVASELTDSDILVLRMELVPFIDQSGLYALESVIEDLHQSDVIVVLCGANEQVLGLLKHMKVIPVFLPEKHVFKDFDSCRKWMRQVLGNPDGIGEELKMLEESRVVKRVRL